MELVRRADTAAFIQCHVNAFEYLGGVPWPRRCLYDNARVAVAKILGDGRRQHTRAFTELQSHYLFDDLFGRPCKGNDKGKVEGLETGPESPDLKVELRQ